MNPRVVLTHGTASVRLGGRLVPIGVTATVLKAEDLIAMPIDELEEFLSVSNGEDVAGVLLHALSMLSGKYPERSRRVLIKRWLKVNVYSEGFRRRR